MTGTIDPGTDSAPTTALPPLPTPAGEPAAGFFTNDTSTTSPGCSSPFDGESSGTSSMTGSVSRPWPAGAMAPISVTSTRSSIGSSRSRNTTSARGVRS